MQLKKITMIFCLLSPSLSFAFMCPTNFNQIEIGNSIEDVNKQCGKPDIEEVKEVKKEGPQEWSYYVPQPVATTTLGTTQGTMKMQIAFDETGKVINISVNGIGVGATTICGGNNIQLGDKMENIKNVCGKPIFVNKQEASADEPGGTPPPDTTKVTTYIYKSNPPATLIFENGKLKEKR